MGGETAKRRNVGEFRLGKWFLAYELESKTKRKKEDDCIDLCGSDDSQPEEEVKVQVKIEECFICEKLNPEYMSTNAIVAAPPVPVCSLECETKYLSQKGFNPITKTQNPNHSQAHHQPKAEQVERVQSSRLIQSACNWWPSALQFYHYIQQRHFMWHSYANGEMEPQVDPIFFKYALHNVYRELDRATAYLRKHIVRGETNNKKGMSIRDTLWMTVCFRLCNKISTFQRVGGIPTIQEYPQFRRKLLKLRPIKGEVLFFPRAEIATARSYINILDAFMEDIDSHARFVYNSDSVKSIFFGFQSRIIGANQFVCWQVVADFLELRRLVDGIDEEEFVWLTPEAKISLLYIFGVDRIRLEDLVHWANLLRKRQTQGFQALGREFPFFLSKIVNLKNIGHALHSFYYYLKINEAVTGNEDKVKLSVIEDSFFRVCPKEFSNAKKCYISAPALYTSKSYLMDTEACEICRDSKDADKTLLCDLCNGLFHTFCVGLTELPPGSWNCESCLALEDSSYEVAESDNEDEVMSSSSSSNSVVVVD